MGIFVEPREPTGLEKFSQAFIQGMTPALKNMLNRQQGLTPYQQISTKQREVEQDNQLNKAITDQMFKLARPEYGESFLGNDPDETHIPYLAAQATKLAKSGNIGTNEAIAATIMGYANQKEILNDIDVRKYNRRNADVQMKEVVKTFKENGITNPNLINRYLGKLRYPNRFRQNVVTALGIKEAPKQSESKGTQITTDIATKYLKRAKGDREEARRLAKKDGYIF